MIVPEAIKILELQEKFEREELKKNYIRLFLSAHRRKCAAVTIVEMESQEKQIQRINMAYSVLNKTEVSSTGNLLLDIVEVPVKDQELRHHKANDKLEEFILQLIEGKKHALCIRLLELAITEFDDNAPRKLNFDLIVAYRLLGKVLIESGLINQGVPYYNYGQSNFERGKSYMEIGDYRSALHFIGKELRKRETDIPYDEVCQLISICYFLVGEYQNAIQIIEDVLPALLPKKQIFEESCKSKKFATVTMICMYRLHKLEGTTLDAIKMRVKYPLCSKYLQNCYGKITEAYKVIEEFEHESEKYDLFLDSLKPENPVKEDIDPDYTIEELQRAYLVLFDEPLLKSLIYNPK